MEELGNKGGVAGNLGNIGTLYAIKNFEGYDAEKAEEYLLKTGMLFEEIGDKRSLYEYHKNLSELYREHKRWEEADRSFQKFFELEREVQSEEAKSKRRTLNINFRSEQEKHLAIERSEAEATKKLLYNTLPPVFHVFAGKNFNTKGHRRFTEGRETRPTNKCL